MVRVPLGILVVEDITSHAERRTRGWYTASLSVRSPSHLKEIVDWVEDNIESSEKHSYFKMNDDILEARFRYKRNYEWFVLRWL